MKLYILQDIVSDISFENLPEKWQFDLTQFSQNKTLFTFQAQALQNALKGLWLYFKDKKGDKQRLLEHYQANGFNENLDYNLDYNLERKETRKIAGHLLEYGKDYLTIDNKISFAYFINRMSFWMATGSGKTLIIVKLIELLGKLILEKELPQGDILFLAHRDDLLEQFKNHIDEFNSFNFDTRINLKNLKEYGSVKRENTLPFTKDEITVFYYRADLISDELKGKTVDFKNYDNNGEWYILLDEAHKGDKEDSKRQIFYSILSRNRFLFNFSATFTDQSDFLTCAFNFNLSKFVEEGYSKHIYVSQSNIEAFKDKGDFSNIEKQKIVLKTLLLLTYINKHFEKIRQVNSSLYLSYRPLLLTLVNSTNIEESDLELFFRELEKVAKDEIQKGLIEEAKKELIEEFQNKAQFEFEELECSINTSLVSSLNYSDILKYVLNADKPGNIEVSKIPGNNQELIFKLKTADKPFALAKIGDISGWLKDKLSGYEISEKFDNESYFRAINRDDSDINILMGSRSFYEGWDSNRPNLLLFVNIGVGSDAKKFVLQSVGRGVRIEPLKNKRKRLQNLFNAKEIDEQLFNEVKDLILPIESLYIFGTKAKNLQKIIKTLKDEKQDKNLGDAFIVNPEAKNHTLLIPTYKTSEKFLTEEQDIQKYRITQNDFDLITKYFEFLDDKVLLAKYNCEVGVLKRVKKSFKNKDNYYTLERDGPSLFDPSIIVRQIFDYFGVKSRELDTFKKLEDEIVHFKRITFSGKSPDEIIRKISQVKGFPQKQKLIEQLKSEYKEHEDIDKYTKAIQELERDYPKELEYNEKDSSKIKIKYLANHYYIPVIVSETEKIDYLNHIINVESEVKFIEQLEEYLAKPNNIFTQFDWWMFSKLDQTVDNVYIPYYNPNQNSIAKFKPDFIFWAKKGDRYLILFVDPKGTEHTDGLRKIDGYSRLFEEQGSTQSKDFHHDGVTINVKLLLYTKNDIANVPDNYKQYWVDNFESFAKSIEDFCH